MFVAKRWTKVFIDLMEEQAQVRLMCLLAAALSMKNGGLLALSPAIGRVALLPSISLLNVQCRLDALRKTRYVESFDLKLSPLVKRHLMLAYGQYKKPLITSRKADQRFDIKAMVHQCYLLEWNRKSKPMEQAGP